MNRGGVYKANKQHRDGVESGKKIRTVQIYKGEGAIEKVFP